MIYRIWNAIKAIFGVSDWQIAHQTVQNNSLEAAYNGNLIDRNPQNNVRLRLRNEVVAFTARTAEDFLTQCLTMQEENPRVTDELRALLVDVGLTQQLEGIKRMVVRVEESMRRRNEQP